MRKTSRIVAFLLCFALLTPGLLVFGWSSHCFGDRSNMPVPRSLSSNGLCSVCSVPERIDQSLGSQITRTVAGQVPVLPPTVSLPALLAEAAIATLPSEQPKVPVFLRIEALLI